MSTEILLFFDQMPAALPLYEAFEQEGIRTVSRCKDQGFKIPDILF